MYKNNYITFYPKFSLPGFRISPASYFDSRAMLNTEASVLFAFIGVFITGLHLISLVWIPFLFIGWGSLYVHFPIKSGIDECEYPEYGFYIYGEGFKVNSFWWCWKRKKYCFNMPWSWDWVRTSHLKKDETWEHETRGNRKDFYEKKWDEILWKESYPYTYVLKNGEIQNRIATVKVSEREWRLKWFKWSPHPSMKRKTIDIEFSYAGPLDRNVLVEKENYKVENKKVTGEVGERTGSYKGGTLGCSYKMLKGETPLQSLRRMEIERNFD